MTRLQTMMKGSRQRHGLSEEAPLLGVSPQLHRYILDIPNTIKSINIGGIDITGCNEINTGARPIIPSEYTNNQ
jgi:hypothetical protein